MVRKTEAFDSFTDHILGTASLCSLRMHSLIKIMAFKKLMFYMTSTLSSIFFSFVYVLCFVSFLYVKVRYYHRNINPE